MKNKLSKKDLAVLLRELHVQKDKGVDRTKDFSYSPIYGRVIEYPTSNPWVVIRRIEDKGGNLLSLLAVVRPPKDKS